MNLSKTYLKLWIYKEKIKNYFVYKRISSQATLEGTCHCFSNDSKILTYFGANSNNIILKDHSELFGTIICWGEGVVEIEEWAKIGYNCIINCACNIKIGKYTAIADGVTIVDHNYHPINPQDRKYMRQTPHGSIERSPLFSIKKSIVIGENVMLGHNVRICKGVTIGDNSIIGANSIVTKDIPANCIAAGNPAKVVKTDIHITTNSQFPLKEQN